MVKMNISEYTDFLPCFLLPLLLLPASHACRQQNMEKGHMLFTKTLLLLTTLGLSKNDFNFAEPQDDQAAFVRAMLPAQQHDRLIQFGSSHLNPRRTMQ